PVWTPMNVLAPPEVVPDPALAPKKELAFAVEKRPAPAPKKELPGLLRFERPASAPKNEFWRPVVFLAPARSPKKEFWSPVFESPEPDPTKVFSESLMLSTRAELML